MYWHSLFSYTKLCEMAGPNHILAAQGAVKLAVAAADLVGGAGGDRRLAAGERQGEPKNEEGETQGGFHGCSLMIIVQSVIQMKKASLRTLFLGEAIPN